MLLNDLYSKKPIGLLTIAYMIALSLIAGMSIGAHLVIKKVIVEQEQSARTINIAGRQRMLSQRTALYLSEAERKPDAATMNILLENINLFERSHLALTQGDQNMGLEGRLPDTVRDVYFREPHNLDQEVQQYIQDVRDLIEGPAQEINGQNPTFVRAMENAKGDLLNKLDRAVKKYEEDADKKILHLVEIQGMSIVAILIVILLEALVIFRPLISRIEKYSNDIETIASTDALTGVMNRRSAFETMGKEMNRSRRYNNDLAVIICDIDHFKNVNDTYGHKTGDRALQHFASVINGAIREEDSFGRIGGEEFVLVLPHTDAKRAAEVAEKLRKRIEESPMKNEGIKDMPAELQITSSFGATVFDKDVDQNPESVCERADKALYQAKSNGRNRVEIG